ncbi:MAG: hypothetical protein DMF89_02695 [Acidobacteria bacterium]|nr:MAG: hypothetical protein DMF89_02695 [Acidobacteriota bacterium]
MPSLLRSLTLDDWYWWLQVALTVAILVAGGLSVVTIQTGRALHKRDSARLSSLEGDLVSARVELGRQQDAAAVAEKVADELMTAVQSGATDEGGAGPHRRVPERSLTLEQRTTLIQLLSAAPGDVQVVGLALDPESQGFAGELVAAFRAGGWVVTRRSSEFKSPPSGLMVWVHDGANPPHRAGTLRFALDTIGFRTTNRRNAGHPTTVPDGGVWLVVGGNPHPEEARATP